MNDFLNQGPYDLNQPGKHPKKENENKPPSNENSGDAPQDWRSKMLDSFNAALGSNEQNKPATNESNEHSGKGPVGYHRSDDRIWEDICESLRANGDVDASRILVTVEDGIVILTGIVDSDEQRTLAMQITNEVAGVRYVENDLELTEEQRLWDISQLN